MLDNPKGNYPRFKVHLGFKNPYPKGLLWAIQGVGPISITRVSFPVTVGRRIAYFVQNLGDSDSLTGGIATTGNYPGRATNPDELMADISKIGRAHV